MEVIGGHWRSLEVVGGHWRSLEANSDQSKMIKGALRVGQDGDGWDGYHKS